MSCSLSSLWLLQPTKCNCTCLTLTGGIGMTIFTLSVLGGLAVLGLAALTGIMLMDARHDKILGGIVEFLCAIVLVAIGVVFYAAVASDQVNRQFRKSLGVSGQILHVTKTLEDVNLRGSELEWKEPKDALWIVINVTDSQGKELPTVILEADKKSYQNPSLADAKKITIYAGYDYGPSAAVDLLPQKKP